MVNFGRLLKNTLIVGKVVLNVEDITEQPMNLLSYWNRDSKKN